MLRLCGSIAEVVPQQYGRRAPSADICIAVPARRSRPANRLNRDHRISGSATVAPRHVGGCVRRSRKDQLHDFTGSSTCIIAQFDYTSSSGTLTSSSVRGLAGRTTPERKFQRSCHTNSRTAKINSTGRERARLSISAFRWVNIKGSLKTTSMSGSDPGILASASLNARCC